jgi:hypothetical protein
MLNLNYGQKTVQIQIFFSPVSFTEVRKTIGRKHVEVSAMKILAYNEGYIFTKH